MPPVKHKAVTFWASAYIISKDSPNNKEEKAQEKPDGGNDGQIMAFGIILRIPSKKYKGYSQNPTSKHPDHGNSIMKWVYFSFHFVFL
jgi:hypothetical protein